MEIPIKLNLPDQEPIDPLGQAMMDTVIATSGVRPRPGSEFVIDTREGQPITGIYDWEEKGLVIVVVNGKVFKIGYLGYEYLLLEDGVNKLMLEDGSGRLLLESEKTIVDITTDEVFNEYRAIFADFGDYLYIASGGRIVEIHPTQSVIEHDSNTYEAIRNNIGIEPGVDPETDTYWAVTTKAASGTWNELTRYGSGRSNYIEDPDCPTEVKWIGVADKYLLALASETQKMYFSVVNEPWSWDQDYVSAEFMPDDAVNLAVFNGDVWIGGRKTIQNFVNDGVTPWVNSQYGAIKNGILAPYSLTNIGNQTAYYIDEQRRLVYMKDRTAINVNESLNTFLNDLAVVDDAIADYIVFDGIQFYILQFPTEGRTIAVNIDNGSWSEWTYKLGGNELRWNANCITYVPSRDTILMGDTTFGFVNSVNSSCNKDLDTPIVTTIRTPRIQTTGRVFVKDLEVGLTKVVKTIDAGLTSTIRVRWRDDGKDWSDYLEKVVDSSQTDHLLHFRRVGSYWNNRQYEFDCSDLYPYAIKRVDQT